MEVTGKCVGAMTCRVLAPEIFHEVLRVFAKGLGFRNWGLGSRV